MTTAQGWEAAAPLGVVAEGGTTTSTLVMRPDTRRGCAVRHGSVNGLATQVRRLRLPLLDRQRRRPDVRGCRKRWRDRS